MNRLKLGLWVTLCWLTVIPARSMDPEFFKHVKYSQLSIRNLKLDPEEKIIGFKLKLQGAYIYSAPMVPIDWTIKVVNDGHGEDPWIFYATGAENHGSGAVKADFFKNFIVIGAFKPTGKPGEIFPRFDLELEITIVLDRSQRTIVLKPKDMIYTPFTPDRVY